MNSPHHKAHCPRHRQWPRDTLAGSSLGAHPSPVLDRSQRVEPAHWGGSCWPAALGPPPGRLCPGPPCQAPGEQARPWAPVPLPTPIPLGCGGPASRGLLACQMQASCHLTHTAAAHPPVQCGGPVSWGGPGRPPGRTLRLRGHRPAGLLEPQEQRGSHSLPPTTHRAFPSPRAQAAHMLGPCFPPSSSPDFLSPADPDPKAPQPQGAQGQRMAGQRVCPSRSTPEPAGCTLGGGTGSDVALGVGVKVVGQLPRSGDEAPWNFEWSTQTSCPCPCLSPQGLGHVGCPWASWPGPEMGLLDTQCQEGQVGICDPHRGLWIVARGRRRMGPAQAHALFSGRRCSQTVATWPPS